jgi:hypothetical protein
MDTLFDTKPHDITVYADTVKYAVCRGRSCHKTLTWATNIATGRQMCFTGKIDANGALSRGMEGTRATWTLPLERNHWKDCPDAADFKRKKR